MSASHVEPQGGAPPLDLSRSFLPDALAGLAPIRGIDDQDRLRLNQIRARSYLHLFEQLEGALREAASAHLAARPELGEALSPLMEIEPTHVEVFRSFEAAFAEVFPVRPRLVPESAALARALEEASPYALLVLGLHLKLETQQHYLACVRGDEALEPRFVALLRRHWSVECGLDTTSPRACSAAALMQRALSSAKPSEIPTALRDYRGLVFAIDDVLHRQADLDVLTLEDARGGPLEPSERAVVLAGEIAAHRKTFLTVGIVNAAFVYAIRALGPTASAALAGVVSSLTSRA